MSAQLHCSQCNTSLAADAKLCPNCGAPTPTDPFVNLVLSEQYHLKRRIGIGGFGAVYEAEEPRVGRRVAVKILHPDLCRDPDLVERFRREAIAASKLEHPAAVKILNFGESNGIAFIVMELLSGETLAEHLKQRTFSHQELIQFMQPVCEALFEAHQKGVIHRDLKPQNLMLLSGWREGHVKVLDFGIAKMLDASSLTKSTAVMGTPAYMAPELWDEQKIFDGRSDLYALGIVAYQMLSGKLPLEATHLSAWVKKHCFEAPTLLSKVLPDVDPALEAAVMKALSKEPEDRHPNALSLLRAFEGSPEPKGPTPPKPSTRRPISKKLGAAILGVALGATYLLYPRETSREIKSPSTKPVSKKTTLSFEWLHPKQTGDNLTSVVQAPSTKAWMVFGWNGTMLRSIDQRTWSTLPRITNEDIFAACSTSAQIIAVASNGTLLQSKDDGLTWSQQTLDGKDLTELFCLSDKSLFIGTSDGKVIESNDAGSTWKTSQIASLDININSVWATSTRAFASATRGGRGYIFCQESGNWTQCNEQDEELFGLFGRDGVLYVSTPDLSLQQSADLAKTWTPLDKNGAIYQFILSPQNALFGAGQHGVFVEQDGGFAYTDHPGLYLRDLWLAKDSSMISVGDGGQLFSDQLDKRVSSHFFNRAIEDIEATSKGLFAVVADYRLWHSSDGGTTWRSASLPAMYFPYEDPLARLSTSKDLPNLFSVFEARDQIYVSREDGRVALWLPEYDSLFEIGDKNTFGVSGVSDGLYDPDTKTLYFAGANGILYFQPDAQEWSSLSLSTGYVALRALKKVGSFLFVIGDSGSLFRVNTDRSNAEKIASPVISSDINLCSITSDSSGRIFVGGASSAYANTPQQGAVFLSEDQGTSWKKVLTTDAMPSVQSINGTVIALDVGKLWSTTDGANWKPLPLPTKTPLTTMATTPEGELIVGGWFGTVAKITLP